MKENRKVNLIITIIGIGILTVSTIGATFAYFTSTSRSSEQNLKTGNIKIDATSSKLNDNVIKPTTWDTLISNNIANNDISQIKLSVNTYGTTIKSSKYDIYLTTTGIQLNDNESLKGGSLEDIKWKLINSSNKIIGEGNFKNGNYTTPTKLNEQSIPIDITASNIEEATKTYILFIYIENNGKQDKLQNLSINAIMSTKAIQ